MKNIFLFIIFLCVTLDAFSQNDLFLLLKEVQNWYTPQIANRIKKQYGKEVAAEYKHLLFIQRVRVKNMDLSTIDINNREDSVLYALGRENAVENLFLSKDPYYQGIIYNDSLRVIGVDCGYLCQTSKEYKALVEYFCGQDADFVLFVEGCSFDYFMLIGNKIYKLVYDEETNRYTKVKV